MNKTSKLLMASSLLMTLAFTSCEKEVQSGLIVTCGASDWSSQEYRGVKLAQYHASESKPNFTVNSPEGYNARFEDTYQTDEKGRKIYDLLVDMPEITQTTTTNDPSSLKIDFEVKYKDGSLKSGVTFLRYKQPIVTASQLNKDWYLYKDSKLLGSDWVSFKNDEAQAISWNIKEYPKVQDSPVTIEYTGNVLTYYSQNTDLPGWPFAPGGQQIPSKIDGGLWKTGSNSEVAILYVTEGTIFCMEPDYDRYGNISDVHYYTFITK